MALLSQAPRSATLLTLGDVRLLCVGKEDFEAILRQRPEVSLVVINVLCERLRQQSTKKQRRLPALCPAPARHSRRIAALPALEAS